MWQHRGVGRLAEKRPVFARRKNIMSSCMWGHKWPLKTPSTCPLGCYRWEKQLILDVFSLSREKNSAMCDYANVLRFKFLLLYMCPSSGSDFPLHAWFYTTSSFWVWQKSCSFALKKKKICTFTILHGGPRMLAVETAKKRSQHYISSLTEPVLVFGLNTREKHWSVRLCDDKRGSVDPWV